MAKLANEQYPDENEPPPPRWAEDVKYARSTGKYSYRSLAAYLKGYCTNSRHLSRGQDPRPRTPDLYPEHLATCIETRRAARVPAAKGARSPSGWITTQL